MNANDNVAAQNREAAGFITDPVEKLTQSIKHLREEAIASMPGEETTINAVADVAAMIVLTMYRNGEQFERIASAIVAQTRVVCAAYNMKASDYLPDSSQSDLFNKG